MFLRSTDFGDEGVPFRELLVGAFGLIPHRFKDATIPRRQGRLHANCPGGWIGNSTISNRVAIASTTAGRQVASAAYICLCKRVGFLES
jgi:hypothetical protein